MVGSLKHRIRDFTPKYGRQLNLDRSKVAKSLEDKLFQVVEIGGGDSLAIYLARWDLECEASKYYKGYIVRSQLKRVPNEAMKYNTSVLEKNVKVALSLY